jgi:hypothetical protein
VQSTRWLGWCERAGGKGEVELGMEACRVLEGCCDRLLRLSSWERMVARREGEQRRALEKMLASFRTL